jgi:hypothetical protein
MDALNSQHLPSLKGTYRATNLRPDVVLGYVGLRILFTENPRVGGRFTGTSMCGLFGQRDNM